MKGELKNTPLIRTPSPLRFAFESTDNIFLRFWYIQIALDNLKEITREKYNENKDNSPRPSTPSMCCNISIYDAYAHYCNFTKKNNQCNISSKNYFEKYIFDNYPEYILDNKFLEPEWYLL